MKSLSLAVLLLLPLAAACATVGPTARELEQALAEARPAAPPAKVARVRCVTFDEEPTEFLCRWRQRDASGAWRRWTTYLAVDSHGYQLIDDVSPDSEGR